MRDSTNSAYCTPSESRRAAVPFAIGLCALLLALAFSRPAIARDYKTLEQKLTSTEASSLFPVVRNVLRRKEAFTEENLKKFDRYFAEYYFPLMSRELPEGLALLEKSRANLMRELRNTRYDEIKLHFAKLIFENMKLLTAKGFHPAVRFNAALLIGLMDERPGEDTGARRSAIPLPVATDFLVAMLETDDGQTPAFAKVAAMQGLMRHARYTKSISSDRLKKLASVAVATATAQRPENRSADGHAWLQSLAAETLGQLGQIGENQNAHDAILGLIGSSKRSLDSRCRAAIALAKLKPQYTVGCGVDSTAAATILAGLAKDIADAEGKDGKKFIDGEVDGFGGHRRGGFDDEPIKFPRRRTLYRLNSVLGAFDAIGGILSDDMKGRTKTLVELLTKLKTAAAGKNVGDLELADALDTIAPKIGDAVQRISPQNDDSDESANEGDLPL